MGLERSQAALVEIGDRTIGHMRPCFVIAEAGVNHNGKLDAALELVDAAHLAGADAVKFQTFEAGSVAGRGAPLADYQKPGIKQGSDQVDMLRALQLSADDHVTIAAHCRARGILFLSSPFDEASADLLESVGVLAYKIPSGEITNLPYLEHIARKGRAMLISTGMATLAEVDTAVRRVERAGNSSLVLLHCVSSYPAPAHAVNLRAMDTLRRAFGYPVGFSDHTLGTEIALAAVALGACVVEKHLTLDRQQPGPDHAASLEPREIRDLCRCIRNVEASLGDGVKRPQPEEEDVRRVARKSLVAAVAIPAMSRIEPHMIAIRRPGTGLPPEWRELIVGRRARVSLDEGSPITLEDLE